MALCICGRYSGQMTARRRSGQESGRRANRGLRTHRAPQVSLGAAVRHVRSAVEVARLVGQLNTDERRALAALIASLARLLDEPVPD
jgi:hypothetical protein